MSDVALLIIDMPNDVMFEIDEDPSEPKLSAIRTIAALAGQARMTGMPVIYLNDGCGNWSKGRDGPLDHVGRPESPSGRTVDPLRPHDDDLVVVKPRFSGFYASSLPVVLPQLGVSRLILTGMAADICVLFTAAGVQTRRYPVWVPSDAVTDEHFERIGQSLEVMRQSMGAETRATTELELGEWLNMGTAPP